MEAVWPGRGRHRRLARPVPRRDPARAGRRPGLDSHRARPRLPLRWRRPAARGRRGSCRRRRRSRCPRRRRPPSRPLPGAGPWRLAIAVVASCWRPPRRPGRSGARPVARAADRRGATRLRGRRAERRAAHPRVARPGDRGLRARHRPRSGLRPRARGAGRHPGDPRRVRRGAARRQLPAGASGRAAGRRARPDAGRGARRARARPGPMGSRLARRRAQLPARAGARSERAARPHALRAVPRRDGPRRREPAGEPDRRVASGPSRQPSGPSGRSCCSAPRRSEEAIEQGRRTVRLDPALQPRATSGRRSRWQTSAGSTRP